MPKFDTGTDADSGFSYVPLENSRHVHPPSTLDNVSQFDNEKFFLDDNRLSSLTKDEESNSGIINAEDEKKLVRKLDLHIMPLFCLFYFSDYLDRANIGNATLAGLQADLGMTATQLSAAISAFFITYILFEIPSNCILKKTSARYWLSFIMLVWGISTVLTAFCTNFTGLMIARLILGAAEAGYIPGIMYILSKVYKPKEFSFRVGILLTMATLSGLCSGPLTYATSYLDGKNGLHGWQYLFIVEGVPTVVLAIVSFFYLFDDLQNVKWLTLEQKDLQSQRIALHQNADTGRKPITIETFKTVFLDWKTWAFSFVFLFNHINVMSITVFAPILIGSFGFTSTTAQLLTAPPFGVATLSVLLGGYLASRFNFRSPLLAAGSIIIAMGYSSLLIFTNKWALYTTLFLIPIGMGLQAAAAIGWSAINYPDLTVRAVAVAAVLMIAFGMIFNLVTSLVSASLSGLTGYILYKENCRRDSDPTEKVCLCCCIA
ncbi:major facilitator superfamily domain-containing protein [Mycotypha africana]|uniref:major facilitator superfamily domain-containing protein n=1 Tax=Mycotypha africana TaxID=64632 RepID=UPI0023002061|nr:major facilitator superfamily domain-containing protein [Mycotypha africana]KAI8987241.1 major facilitator superfamily domain-containing protein [Mycotypha africana]